MHKREPADERTKKQQADAEADALTVPLEGDDEFWWHDAHDGWSGIRKREPAKEPEAV